MIHACSLLIHAGISRNLGTDLFHHIGGFIAVLVEKEFMQLCHICFQCLRNYTVTFFTYGHIATGIWEAACFTNVIFTNI